MRTIAIGLSLALVALAQDPPDYKAELKGLEQDYQKAQQEFYAAARAAKTDAERAKVYREQNPAKPYLEKFQDLAKRAGKDPATAASLGWVFTLASQASQPKVAREAAERLLADFPGDKALAQVAAQFQHPDPSKAWAKDWLMSVLEKTSTSSVKLAAMFSLGCQLMGSKDETVRADGRAFFELIVKNQPGSPQSKRAEGQIFELDRLQIGMEAPDFEAKDIDGKPFKLSDYRGKVVVVDFWGFW